MTKGSPFRDFKTRTEVIRLTVMLHIPFLLSLRNVGGLLHERGIEILENTLLTATQHHKRHTQSAFDCPGGGLQYEIVQMTRREQKHGG